MATPTEKVFDCVTSSQVERTYHVLATDDDQARSRLRIHLKDSGVLREGLVTAVADSQKDTTAQKIMAIKEAKLPPAKPAGPVTPPPTE